MHCIFLYLVNVYFLGASTGNARKIELFAFCTILAMSIYYTTLDPFSSIDFRNVFLSVHSCNPFWRADTDHHSSSRCNPHVSRVHIGLLLTLKRRMSQLQSQIRCHLCVSLLRGFLFLHPVSWRHRMKCELSSFQHLHKINQQCQFNICENQFIY